ncbi:phosphotransferase enzyme family protein [Paenibacillus sp. OV219]|uniref:phosphotransferase enzyme family protein n=1 Tax=Paenibacillus sp. OV219 TaxID=1884377 RepID=UPI0008B1E5D9|nr:phosphotransferase [Paenibacillus sp. OV219]SEN49715.1 Ser/Thr protein kinase RdoA involved in Cpx stress response, MazF antagonist [Paenibacillus sp. OV219]
MVMNGSDPTLPGSEVLDKLKINMVAPLGGRLNQHWLVNDRNERLVLRLWSSATDKDSIQYEVNLLNSIAELGGWPVAAVIEGPIEIGGQVWGLFPYLQGEPPSSRNPAAEGRLMAQFHNDLRKLSGVGQRKGWRRCEEILQDNELDLLLSENEKNRPEEIRILRWHLERARKRVEGLKLHSRPGIVIHGDFAPWNLRFQDGKLSGILDFELAHWDHRVGEFALSWRGKYDEVVYGYDEVSPLEPEEWELLTPMWWAVLIELACKHLKEGSHDDGWIIRKLLERSPLMGQDARTGPTI